MNRRAFTLIELLVVISIIGLLSAIAVVSLGSARVKTRNTKRNTDIKQLALALNLAYDANGSFPNSGSTWVCLSSACTGSWGSIAANGTVDGILFGADKYMASKPTDPTGDTKTYGGYLYSNVWGGGTAPYDSYVFPTGAYLDWMLATTSGISCGSGRIWSSNSINTECLLILQP